MLVTVKIFQFHDMLNENRFLGIFLGHGKRPIIYDLKVDNRTIKTEDTLKILGVYINIYTSRILSGKCFPRFASANGLLDVQLGKDIYLSASIITFSISSSVTLAVSSNACRYVRTKKTCVGNELIISTQSM
jgi:hypothetical protein